MTQPAPNLLSDGRPAAFTIACRADMPRARALAGDYLRLHPGHGFVLAVVDPVDASPDDPWETLSLDSLQLPGGDAFLHAGTDASLCRAVLPFCLRQLRATSGFGALLYLACGTVLVRPLAEAWQALQDSDVLLLPCRLTPEAGTARGAYSQDMFGLRCAAELSRLLDAWCEHGYRSLLESGPDGWMDALPAYVEQAAVLREPGYGVTRDNLPERGITATAAGISALGAPLTTFDGALCAGGRQSQVDPAWRQMCEQSQHAASIATQAGTGRILVNGVELPPAAHAAVADGLLRGIAWPSPIRQPDRFCEFLATPDAALHGYPVAPLIWALLARRPDVAAAFPDALRDPGDEGFHIWLSSAGTGEEHLGSLLAGFGQHLRGPQVIEKAPAPVLQEEDVVPVAMVAAVDPVTPVLPRKSGKHGFRGLIPARWTGTREIPAVVDDIPTPQPAFAPAPEPEPVELVDEVAAQAACLRVVDAYFADLTLQNQQLLLYSDASFDGLATLLRASSPPKASAEDIRLFRQGAPRQRESLLRACLRYNPFTRERAGGLPSILNLPLLQAVLDQHNAGAALPALIDILLEGDWMTPYEQFHAYWEGHRDLQLQFPDIRHSAAETLACARHVLQYAGFQTHHRAWHAWEARLLAQCAQPRRAGVNLVGYLHARTGMGELVRSMARQLDQAQIPSSCLALPAMFAGEPVERPVEHRYGAPDPRLDTTLVVANADDFARVRAWLPAGTWGWGPAIGCWIWETETMPQRCAPAARGLSAIWTSSTYSAAAIRAVVDLPVEVVPLSPDFARLARARPDRETFGLPSDVLLFGFFFDCRSELERKNPAAAIDAFRAAFGARDDVALVLKVSAASQGRYDYQMLKARAQDLPVYWIEQELDREASLDLMASLDVYVSLHRAEGFGLTMAEAMALGKPVVATGYSGNMDFMDAECACLVIHDVVTTTRDYGPYPSGSRWAEPSVVDAARHMAMLAGDAGRRRQLGESGRARVLRDLAVERTAAALRSAWLQAPSAIGLQDPGDNPHNPHPESQ